MTYELDGEQYVAVMVGVGGAGGIGAEPRRRGPAAGLQAGRDGQAAALSAGGRRRRRWTSAVAVRRPRATPTAGGASTASSAATCHGGGGFLPNLRDLAGDPGARTVWKAIVLDGALTQNGMAGFKRFLNPDQVESIRAYLLDQARASAKR